MKVLVGVLVAVIIALGAYTVWQTRQLQAQIMVITRAQDSVITVAKDSLKVLVRQRDSLGARASASRVEYVTKWSTHWDTLKVAIDRPDLTLPEAKEILKGADSVNTACSLALRDCSEALLAAANKDRVDSLAIVALEARMETEKQRPRGSSFGTKMAYALGGATVAATACAVVR